MSSADNKRHESCTCEKRESRPSQWEQLLRKFSESNKEECKNVPVSMPTICRSLKVFPTGSQYEGRWDVLGMGGKGTYTFPNGVIYEGEIEDGMFHGVGELRYPSGAVIKGKWQEGIMYERTLIFPDGLQYSEHNWRYCKKPDRRFTSEYDEGLRPAGESIKTAQQPTREIPPGFYDTIDGFYDPITKAVYRANDLTSIVRSPDALERRWIMENCRYASEVNIGPKPMLYEEWSKPNIDERKIRIPSVMSGRALLPYVPPCASSIEENLNIKLHNLGEDTDCTSDDSD